MPKTPTSSPAGPTKTSITIAAPVNFRLILDPRWGRAKATEILLQRQRARQTEQAHHQRLEESQKLVDQAGDATRDPYTWATRYTETYNQHWVEEHRPSPYERFPSLASYPHLYDLFELLAAERINWFEKSRDMMVTWGCVAYLMLQAQIVPAREVLLQTQKIDKVKQLIKYAKCLYRRQPEWLQDAFPLTKHVDSQPDDAMVFRHGGAVIGIPGGADQIRSYHPWGYLNDESSFQPDAGDCYNEALSAVKGEIVFNSSAGPGWFADVRRDIIINVEE